MDDTYTRLRLIIDDEIVSARKSARLCRRWHWFILVVVIVSGALATFFAAIGLEDKNFLVAFLAMVTTIFGTFEKTFSFSKDAAGYRDAKIRFQNLRLELVTMGANLTEEKCIQIASSIKEIRVLKAELTSSS